MSTQQRTNRGHEALDSSSTSKCGDGKYEVTELPSIPRRTILGALGVSLAAALVGYLHLGGKEDSNTQAEHQPTPEEQATRLVDAYSAYLSQREAYEAGKTTEEPQLPANLDGIVTLAVEAGDSIGSVVDRHIATLAEADTFHAKPEQDGVTNATSARVAELYLTDGDTRYELQPGDIVILAQYQGFVVPLAINPDESSSSTSLHTLEP
ncbi:MAG: hypothetical protein D8B38_04340 [Candidatus Saccharimonas sp.]|nr:MAG: hypothetical protein D8B38_04340 [Candidatus Saccharimonas sp.]